MTATELYNELNYVNHSREKRNYYANLMINNPNLIPKLLDILFKVDDKISPRAAWVFEFMCSKNIDFVVPHLSTFTQNIKYVHIDAAVRPVAKVCELIAMAYKNNHKKITNALTQTHKELIIETCFDYLINDEKVAPKAYSMTTLYIFGKEYDWIYPELITILERDFTLQSAAFKARAKQVLKKIK
ncbi:adenylosuccinate lyase [Seonamhaeicola algicola]|uniref:Adenylosuccinate lyase n=1 Tax=Seonamhaeicola algicola TaxID=1719036 RepID=A0A5C7AP04_9FLAO|nr:adenylosuccinate lyase [Seonamhaeicola algicola]TXE10077.1 adenylosuccinate lyase [Seonamhaeicola algicola]